MSQTYLKDGAVDTFLLGTEILGTRHKNGPEKQKFWCSQCKLKRWVIDSQEGCSANLTRHSICSFCDVRNHTDREIRKQNVALQAEIKKISDRVVKELGEFSSKLSELDGGNIQPQVQESPGRLRQEFDALRSQLVTEVDRIKSRVEERTLVTPVVPVSDSVSNNADSPRGAEGYIDDMFRQVVTGPKGMSVTLVSAIREQRPPNNSQELPTSNVVPTKEQSSSRRKTRRRGRKVKPTTRQEVDEPFNLLIGDSQVGRATANNFIGLGPNYACGAYHGAGVRRIIDEVKKLNSTSKNTLVLSVGGNDFFRRDQAPCDVNALMRDYNNLLKVARSKTGRCVVVGIIPRKFFGARAYNVCRDVNRRLGDLCRKMGLKFVDMWDNFFMMDRLFVRDGIHFSDQGSSMFIRLLSQNLYRPPRVRRPRKTTTREVPRPQTRESEEITLDINNNGTIDVEKTPSPNHSVTNDAETSNSSAMIVDLVVTPIADRQDKRQRSVTPDLDTSPVVQPNVRKKTRRASDGDMPPSDSPPPVRGPSGND